MKRVIVGVLVGLSTLVPTASHAVVTDTPTTYQNYNFYYGASNGTGYIAAYLNVTNMVGATVNDASVTPSANFHASGGFDLCDANWNCTGSTFDDQQVAPTAFSADPIGNSLHFTACLKPNNNAPCKNFDLSMVRPSMLFFCNACVQPNAWFDPTTNKLGASTYGYAGIYRGGYTISGLFAGTTVSFSQNGMDNFTEGVTVFPRVVAP